MPHRDSGVTELLHRASDDLTPDVDRLVSGGIARGRTRQRRARIGTTVASLAVIGVVGALAAVVPHLGEADSARDPGIATEGPSATDSPTPQPPATSTPTRLTVPADEVPATVERVLALSGRTTEPLVHVDDDEEKYVQFLVDGMVTDVGMQSSETGSTSTCQEDARRLGGSCEEEAGGGLMLSWGPTLADGVTCQGVNLDRYGFDVWATSCNAAEGKDSPPLAPLPPLSLDDLRVIARTHVWFN